MSLIPQKPSCCLLHYHPKYRALFSQIATKNTTTPTESSTETTDSAPQDATPIFRDYFIRERAMQVMNKPEVEKTKQNDAESDAAPTTQTKPEKSLPQRRTRSFRKRQSEQKPAPKGRKRKSLDAVPIIPRRITRLGKKKYKVDDGIVVLNMPSDMDPMLDVEESPAEYVEKVKEPAEAQGKTDAPARHVAVQKTTFPPTFQTEETPLAGFITTPTHVLTHIFTYIPFAEYCKLSIICANFWEALNYVDWNLFVSQGALGDSAQPAPFLSKYMSAVPDANIRTVIYPGTHIASKEYSVLTKEAFHSCIQKDALVLHVSGYIPRRLTPHLEVAWKHALENKTERLQNPFHEIVSWRSEKKRLRDKMMEQALAPKQPPKKIRRTKSRSCFIIDEEPSPTIPTPKEPNLVHIHHSTERCILGESDNNIRYYSREPKDESTENDEETYEVERIVAHRGGNEYFIKWKGYPAESNTWEKFRDIKDSAPVAIEQYERLQGALRRDRFKSSLKTKNSNALEDVMFRNAAFEEKRQQLKMHILNQLNKAHKLRSLHEFVTSPHESRIGVDLIDGRTWESIMKSTSHITSDVIRNYGSDHLVTPLRRRAEIAVADSKSNMFHFGQLEMKEIVAHTRAGHLNYMGSIDEEALLLEQDQMRMMEEYLSTNQLDIYDADGQLKSEI